MHSDPELLALMALGEDIGAVDRSHVASCSDCTREVAELSQLVGFGRTAESRPELLTPPQRVWDQMVLELGLGGSSDDLTGPVAVDLADAGDQVTRGRDTGTNGTPTNGTPTNGTSSNGTLTNGTSSNETSGAPRHAADEPPAGPRSPRRARRLVALVLAAVFVLVAGIALGNVIKFPDRSETIAQTQLDALPQWPGSNGSAHVERAPDGRRFLVITMSTPAPVDGSREVWLINSGVTEMRALGYVTGSSGRWAIPDELDLSQFPIVDVSREPVDDPSPAHSKNSIVRGTLAQ